MSNYESIWWSSSREPSRAADGAENGAARGHTTIIQLRPSTFGNGRECSGLSQSSVLQRSTMSGTVPPHLWDLMWDDAETDRSICGDDDEAGASR